MPTICESRFSTLARTQAGGLRTPAAYWAVGAPRSRIRSVGCGGRRRISVADLLPGTVRKGDERRLRALARERKAPQIPSRVIGPSRARTSLHWLALVKR